MTLRLKVVVSVALALVVSAGLIYGISHSTLLREIESIETKQMERDVQVARGALSRDLLELDVRVFDYSAWDTSYEFVLHPSQAYIDSNLPDNLYESFLINMIAFVRPDGSVSYGTFYDLETGDHRELPTAVTDVWTSTGPYPAYEQGPVSGIVNTAEGTFLMASRPILRSDESGPSRGALVMGRLLDSSLMDSLKRQTQLNMSVQVLSPSATYPEGSAPFEALAVPGAIAVEPVDGRFIEGYQTVDDVSGAPALLLQVRSPRVIYEHGSMAVTRYLWSVLAIVFGLGIALNLALGGWVLTPVRQLVKEVRGLAAEGGRIVGRRIEVGKGAEFGALGKEINHLLDELETAQSEISQLYGQAREQADRDAVTGLRSRRAIFEGLERRLQSARERHGRLAVLMIDIDGFKLFNDAYGHLAGDSVLRIVSRVITSRIRELDLAGRFGGDEILVVLSNTDAEGAVAQASRLLQAAYDLGWKAPDGTEVPISLSIGVAAFPGHASELNELLAYADANLYAVKQAGRRGVSSGTAEGEPSPDAQAYRPSGYGFGMLDSLITALSEKDQYTRKHAEDVASFSVRTAEALGLDSRMVRAVRIAGLLHDVGKTGIPGSLLLRPGPLTEQESDLMRRHVDIGVSLIRDVPELDEVLAAVGSHHEHVDGTGYPNGLRGDEIPLSGRILAVADAFSAMISSRPYRRPRTPAEAEGELRSMAGLQLDERLVEVFLATFDAKPAPEPAATSRETAAAPAARLAEEGA